MLHSREDKMNNQLNETDHFVWILQGWSLESQSAVLQVHAGRHLFHALTAHRINIIRDKQQHSFNKLFSRTICIGWQQKGKPIWILMKQEMMGWQWHQLHYMQWHQLNHMQIICILLQTDNHASISSLNFFTGWMLFLTPNEHCQSNEGNAINRAEKYQNTNVFMAAL